MFLSSAQELQKIFKLLKDRTIIAVEERNMFFVFSQLKKLKGEKKNANC
jgi:hypothetical protein